MKLKKMNKIIIGLLLIVVIGIILCISNRAKDEEKLYIGDSFSTYRLMDRYLSFTYLTSIQKSEENRYYIIFTQYYDGNPYEYTFDICCNDYIFLYKRNKTFTKSKRCQLYIREIDKDHIVFRIE